MFQRLRLQRIAAKLLVAGRTPNIDNDAVFLRQNLLSAQHFAKNGAAAEQMNLREFGIWLGNGSCRAQFVEAAQDAFLGAGGHRQHRVLLVADSQIIEHALAQFIHAANAVLHDDGQFVGVSRIVGDDVGNRRRREMAVAVLML